MFYLGVHHSNWLQDTAAPLFVSRTRLKQQKLPRALGPWALDSGGFTQLSRPPHCWTLSPAAYVAEVRRFRDEIGNLQWVAPQDWMCEPFVIEKTGLTVDEHQRRTVDNFLELRAELGSLVIPVLQGWEQGDYERCVGLYDDTGVDLRAEPLVGLGTVCRRQDTAPAERIVRSLAAAGMHLHGFGVKITGLERFWDALASCDSMAWSYRARARQRDGLPSCDPSKRKTCGNCLHFALDWRERVVPLFDPDNQPLWKERPCCPAQLATA